MVGIKKLAPSEGDAFLQLIRVFEDVFAMEDFVLPGPDHLQQLLAKQDFGVFVAVAGGRVIGGLTNYTLQQYYSESPLVYIYDLAVQTEFQRQAIGRRLISEMINYYKELGVEEVFVQADLVDEHAIDFYRSTGASAEEVIHFSYRF